MRQDMVALDCACAQAAPEKGLGLRGREAVCASRGAACSRRWLGCDFHVDAVSGTSLTGDSAQTAEVLAGTMEGFVVLRFLCMFTRFIASLDVGVHWNHEEWMLKFKYRGCTPGL